jgi:hypothetical protein
MSSFFLYIHPEKLNNQSIKKISVALTSYPWVTAEVQSINGGQLISTINRSKNVRIFKDVQDGNIFVLQGEVYPSFNGLKDFVDTDSGLENEIIRHYKEHSIDGCAGLNGIYNLIVYSPRKNIFEVATPRLHLLQIYFIPLAQNNFVITNCLAAAKYIPQYHPRVDKTALFELMYMGRNLGEITILQDVIRFQPNSSYKIEQGQLHLRKSSRLPFSHLRWGDAIPQLIKEFEEIYSKAIIHRIKPNDKVLCLQSGGKDSRVYSYFLKECGIKPQVLAAGENHHAEVAISRMVAKKLGFPFINLPIDENYEYACADQFFKADSYSSEIYCPWPMSMFSKLGYNWDCVTGCYLADAMMGNEMYSPKTDFAWDARGYFENYLEKQHIKFTTREELNALFKDEAEGLLKTFEERSFQQFQSFGNEPFEKIIAYDLITDDCYRLGGIIRGINSACPMILPVLDNDIMDFCLSLPPALLSKRLFLDVFLTQKAKCLASIPFDQNTGQYSALLPSMKDEIRFRLWHETTKLVRMPILKMTAGYKATTQFYGQLYNLNLEGIRRLKQEAVKDLDLLDGFMDKEAARKILLRQAPDNLYHVNAGNAPRSLVTVIHALKYF